MVLHAPAQEMVTGERVYAVLIEVVVWAVLLPLTIARIAAGRATWGELRARMGWDAPTAPGALLIHAVSGGEMRAASALIGRPWLAGPIILSTGTSAGLTVANELRAGHQQVRAATFLPWDRRAIRRWLSAAGVSAVIVTEAELWPSLFFGCRALGLPLFVVSARLRAGDRWRYRLAPRFFGAVLECAQWIGTQEAEGRDDFIAIGAPPHRVEVAGNLKLAALRSARSLPPHLHDLLSAGRLLVAGSTHDPEERWLLDDLRGLRRHHGLRLVIAPRDIGRASAIAQLAAARGLTTRRWSSLAAAAARQDWDLLIVDEFGWLPVVYRYAALVFLGGTLTGVGGHNIIEPIREGCPVVVGPCVADISPVVARLETTGAVVRLPADPGAGHLLIACAELLARPGEDRQRAARQIADEGPATIAQYDRAIAARLG